MQVINPFVLAAALMTDSFDRANNAASLGSTDGGSMGPVAWTATSGTWGINGNLARVEVVGAGNLNIATVDPGATPSLVTVTLATLVTTGGGMGLVSKFSDTSNYYLAWAERGSTDVHLYKVVAGAITDLGSGTPYGLGSIIGLSVVGSAVEVLVDGVVKVSVTDSAVPAGTKCGIVNTETTTPGVGRFNNFAVTA